MRNMGTGDMVGHIRGEPLELAQISFTDGKNRGRTFEEVWNNDHDNGYKNWPQKRLHDIDIVYPAFVVYAELMESLQRRPSWRVHQNQ